MSYFEVKIHQIRFWWDLSQVQLGELRPHLRGPISKEGRGEKTGSRKKQRDEKGGAKNRGWGEEEVGGERGGL